MLKQLAHELDVIEQAGLAGYFLIVWDIVHFARSQGIRCQGRGSAANSIVAYLLGITSIDPLQHNLLFERFLSTDKFTTPDIDVDFAADRREEVIQYVYRRYGAAHTAMVCNTITYRARSPAPIWVKRSTSHCPCRRLINPSTPTPPPQPPTTSSANLTPESKVNPNLFGPNLESKIPLSPCSVRDLLRQIDRLLARLSPSTPAACSSPARPWTRSSLIEPATMPAASSASGTKTASKMPA